MSIDVKKKSDKVVIKWTNRFSNESGYVRDVNRDEQHFDNTFVFEEAKVYGNKSVAAKVIKSLVSYGEGENNTFEVVPV